MHVSFFKHHLMLNLVYKINPEYCVMQNSFHNLDWNEFNQVRCETLKGDSAKQIAIELGLDILNELQESIKLANNSYALRTSLNPSKAMGRWGDICESAALILNSQGWKQFRKHGQPCLVSADEKIQLVFMSPNSAFGNELEVISTSYPKGIATELKLLANTSHYTDHEKIRTFIVYYQPCNKIEEADSESIPFEIAYATGVYKVKKDGEKAKCYPINHTLRLIFTDFDDDLAPYQKPLPDDGNDITEDDFGDLQAI